MRIDEFRQHPHKRLIQEGITHIEDMAIDQMIDALRKFEEYEISEKVDGSNLQFGYDDLGFYTSRESKMNSPRIRSEEDYNYSFHTTFQRAAHAALEKIVPHLINENLLIEGDAIEIEVLFGRLPNTVPYDSDVNRIIFLNAVSGNPNLTAIRNFMKNKRTKITILAPYTTDGVTIELAHETYKWEFVQTPTISMDKVTKDQAISDIDEELDALEEFMKADSGIHKFSNAEVLSLPLNVRPESVNQPDWKELKSMIKDKRIELNNALSGRTGLRMRIKEILLNTLVRDIRSDFGPEIKDGGWIEGVVFRHKDTGEMFKIVDKDLFTAVNTFLWKVRRDLNAKARSVSDTSTFVSRLLINLATSIGHPEIGTNQAKHYMRKMGSTSEEILSNLAKDMPFARVKMEWHTIITSAHEELSELLDDYNSDRKNLKINVQMGDIDRTFRYNDDVHQRTLQVFAALYADIEGFKIAIRRSTRPEELVLALIGQKLNEL